MKYQITIEEVYEVEGKDYPRRIEIYKQQIDNINIAETVNFLNKGESAKVGSIQNPDTGFYSPQYTTGEVPL